MIFSQLKVGNRFMLDDKPSECIMQKVTLNLLYYVGAEAVKVGNNIFLPEFFEIEPDTEVIRKK
jgi:hypothetical protein